MKKIQDYFTILVQIIQQRKGLARLKSHIILIQILLIEKETTSIEWKYLLLESKQLNKPLIIKIVRFLKKLTPMILLILQQMIWEKKAEAFLLVEKQRLTQSNGNIVSPIRRT
jgi:hypothetical protein